MPPYQASRVAGRRPPRPIRPSPPSAAARRPAPRRGSSRAGISFIVDERSSATGGRHGSVPAGRGLGGGGERAEHPPVPARGEAGRAPEQAAEDGGVPVADRRRHLLARRGLALEQALGGLHAQVPHVVDQRHAGGRLEAVLERPLGRATRRDHSGDRARLAELRGEPGLGAAHEGIGVRLAAHRAGTGALPLGVPLEQVDQGDPQRPAGPAMARHDVDRQIVPGSRAAGGDDPPGRVREAEARFGAEVDRGEAGAEQLAAGPVRGGAATVEQPGGRQQHRAGAGRVEVAAGPPAPPHPVEHLGIAPLEGVVGGEPELGQDHDPGRRVSGDRELGADRDAVAAAGRLARGRHDPWAQERDARRLAHELAPERAGATRRVDHAVEGRAGGLGQRQDQHLGGAGWLGLHALAASSGTIGSFRAPPGPMRAAAGSRPPAVDRSRGRDPGDGGRGCPRPLRAPPRPIG